MGRSGIRRSSWWWSVILVGLGGCSSGRLVSFPADPAGTNPSSLNSAFSENSPALAGRWLAFVSDRRGSQDVLLYDIQDRRMVELPELNAFDTIAASPSLSEDGRWIAFSASRQGRTDIYLYDRTTRQLRNLTQTLQLETRNPQMSADGSRIVFEIERSGQWDIAVYTREGQPIDIP
jgi:Tol biopolymer transport system component